MDFLIEEVTKSSLLISKSKLSSLPHPEFPSNELKAKLCNPTTYKQFEIRNVSRRVSDGERPLSEAAATCKRGLTGRKERTPVSMATGPRNVKNCKFLFLKYLMILPVINTFPIQIFCNSSWVIYLTTPFRNKHA